MKKKPTNYAKYKVRTCNSMHECAVCRELIELGDRYHDGGYGRRAHTDCAIRHEADLMAKGEI